MREKGRKEEKEEEDEVKEEEEQEGLGRKHEGERKEGCVREGNKGEKERRDYIMGFFKCPCH